MGLKAPSGLSTETFSRRLLRREAFRDRVNLAVENESLASAEVFQEGAAALTSSGGVVS